MNNRHKALPDTEIASFLSAVAEGITVQESPGQLVYANDAAAKVMGLNSADELLGIPPPELLKRFRVFGEDGKPFPHERMPGRIVLDGQQAPPTIMRYVNIETNDDKWALVKALPVRDERGDVKYAVNIFTDITETKRAERTAVLTAARLEAVLNTAFSGIITIDEQGIIQTVNRTVVRLFQYQSEELVGRNISMLMPEPDRSRHDSYLHNYLTTGDAKIIGTGRGVEGRRKDGSIFPMDLAVSETTVNGERFFTGIVLDVSGRKESEQALRISEERLRETFENAAVGIVEVDIDHRLLRVNRKYCEITGYEEDELLGKNVLNLMPEEERHAPPQVDALLHGDITHFYIEKRYLHKRGGTVWVAITASLRRNPDGSPLHFISIVEDISSRKRTEMRLAAEHAVSKALATTHALEKAMQGVLDALCNSLNVDVAELWLPEEDDQSIRCVNVRTLDTFEFEAQWKEKTAGVRYKRGQVLPGIVWASKAPRWFLDFDAAPEGPRKAFAIDLGLQSNFGFPLLDGERCIGVICLHTREKLVEDDLLQESLSSLGRDIAQVLLREQVDNALRESEERFRVAIKNSNFIPAQFDRGLRYRWFYSPNPEFEMPQVIGKRDDELDDSAATKRLTALKEWVLETGVGVQEEISIQLAEDTRTYDFTIEPLRDSSGAIVGITRAAFDITKRKQVEQALFAERSRLEAVLQQLPEGVIIAEAPTGKLLLGNEQVDRIWGHDFVASKDINSYEAYIGFHVDGTRYLPHEWPLARTISTGETVDKEEVRFQRGDGSFGWMMISSTPIHDASGETVAAVATFSDISERKNANALLSESEQRYRGTFENAAVGVAHIRTDGQFLRVNQKLGDMLGYEVNQLLSSNFREVTHPDDLPDDLVNVRRLLDGEIPEYTIEKRCTRKDGSPIWLSVTRSLARHPDGTPDYFIAVAVDISVQKVLEENLKQSNTALEQRVHERTTELETLTASLRLLAARLSQVEQTERRHLAALIHDDLQQLLVAARMQVSRPHSAGDEKALSASRELAVSLLDKAIEEARSLTTQLRPPALYESGLNASLGWLAGWMEQAHNFDVKLNLDKSAQNLPEQDAVLLFDCVRELLLNVVKYSGVSTASVFLSGFDKQWLILTVSDSGSGFDVTKLETPRTDNGGFGLFGIRERIAAMGGQFELHSSPGKGTTVNLRWPMTHERKAEFIEVEPVSGSPRPFNSFAHIGSAPVRGQITMLLVDDHTLVRQSLADVLERQPDISVIAEASDGEQAVRAVENYRPDVVVMDVNMPKLNGIQACRIIKDRFPEVRVIGVSIHNDSAISQAMLDAGASAYLSKDGPVDALLETIRNQVRVTNT